MFSNDDETDEKLEDGYVVVYVPTIHPS